MTLAREVLLDNEAATEKLGASLASAGLTTELVFLKGDLGAGKTTVVRGFLHALGHDGVVKSPTYTLLETYELNADGGAPAALRVYHFDFYRIVDPRELGYMGIDELLGADAVKLIEWPENAGGRLPDPHIEVRLEVVGTGRHAEVLDHR